MMDAFTLAAKLVLNDEEFEKGLGDAKGKAERGGIGIGGVLGTAGKIAGAAIAASTTAMVAFGGSSVSAGADFDKAMSQVQATMLKTSEEMENEVGSVDTAYGHFSGNLREFAQFLGQNTAFSATQAAEALNYMALAGYKTQESLDMLPNVLSLAAAGNFDLARASDMVTDAQTAFGIDAERTTQMVDEMAKTASVTNTNVEQLGDAFLVVGGLAQDLNGGFITLADGTKKPVDGVNELEIALGAMASAGVKGSEAGTHMRNMLLKLSSPTDDGIAAFQKLGTTIFDTEGNMRSLKDIFSDMSKGMENLTQQEKLQAISDIFNTRDVASAEAILSAVGKDWDEIGANILEAKGSAAEMAAIQLDNLQGDMTLFKSALEGAQIVVSEQLTPSIREFVKFGTEGLSTLTTAFKDGGLNGAMEALGTLLTNGLSMVVERLPMFVGAGMQLLGAIGQGIIDNFPTLLSAAGEILAMLWNGIVEGLPSFTEKAVEIMNSLGEGLRTAIPNLLPVALEALMSFSGNLRENAGKLIDAALSLILALAEGLIKSLPALVKTVPTIVSNIAGIINDNAPKVLKAGAALIRAIIKGIVETVPTLIAEFPKIVKAIFDVIMAIKWLDLGSNIIKGIGNGIKYLSHEIPELMKNIGHRALEFLKSINWLELGSSIIQMIGNGIMSLMSSIPSILSSVGQTAMVAFRSIDWAGLGWGLISGITAGVLSGASNLINSMINVASNALSAVKGFLGIASPSKKARDLIGKNFALGIGVGFQKNMPIKQMVDSVEDAFDQIEGVNAPILGAGVEDMIVSTDTEGAGGFGTTYSPEVNINVYATENQNVKQLAREIQKEFVLWEKQRGYAFA